MKKILLSILLLFSISKSNFAQPLAGNYTINSALQTGGTNFQSFNSFADSINLNGVSGNVNATVQPGSGPYHEKVIFNNVSGTALNSQVTIDGSGETITAVTDTGNRYIFRLLDVSFFNVKNLHVVYDTASTGGFLGIHIMNSGSDISISHCDVFIGPELSTLYGSIIASGSYKFILDSGDFHRINFIGNTCTGGGYGISLFGKASNLATDIVIDSNTIYDFNDNGIYLRETNGTIVSSNHINPRTSSVSTRNSIQIAQSANINADIHSNFISCSATNIGTQTFRGVYLFGGTGHKVYNNVIHDINLTSGDVTGIEVRATGMNPKIYYNTISIDNPSATAGDLIGFKESLSNTNSELRNNMISISQQTSGLKGGIALSTVSSVTTAINSEYNNFHVPGGNVAFKGMVPPTYYPTLIDWINASTQDAHSLNLDPIFISPTNSIPTSILLDDHGISLATYTVDILGNLRSFTPDIGAYEYIGSVGINHPNANRSLDIFPNPIKDRLTLHIPENINSSGTLLVLNSLGKIVYEKNIAIMSKDIQFDFGMFADGYYFVRLEANGITYQGEFLK